MEGKMRQKQYERKIGTKTVMGTDWPVHLIVFRDGSRYALAERCNGICRLKQSFRTRAEAEIEAETYPEQS